MRFDSGCGWEPLRRGKESGETTLHSRGESPSLEATESSRFEKTESL